MGGGVERKATASVNGDQTGERLSQYQQLTVTLESIFYIFGNTASRCAIVLGEHVRVLFGNVGCSIDLLAEERASYHK